MNKEKIILCGPSGSGKTTLAKYISEIFDIPFIQGSASLIMKPEDQKELKDKYDYNPVGHKNVVNLSSSNPQFGIDFQNKLLNNRIEMFGNYPTGFVTDRSPLDSVSYYLNQCVHNTTEEETEEFINKAKGLYELAFTHLIYVRCVNPHEIEDNGSRIINKYFQKKVDAIFDYVLREYFLPKEGKLSNVNVLIINYWDLTQRKSDVVNFLTDNQVKANIYLNLPKYAKPEIN